MKEIVDKNFFKVDTISLAQNLIGKWIVTNINGIESRLQISETEAYLGVNDSACHTYKGKKTNRTLPMWQDGGTIYIYLCYGLHNLLNIVSDVEGIPEAVLIRAGVGFSGPAKLTKHLHIDRALNGECIVGNNKIKIFDDGKTYKFEAKPRVGIAYALEPDVKAKLRFVMKEEK